MKSYIQPKLPAGVEIASLVPEDAKANELTPDTIVTCINRGRQPLVDKYDGRDYRIPPGYIQMPYGAAVHFQRRQIVPGTKNLTVGGYKSWIGILGVDKDAACRPFTDDELQSFGEKVEAIDRTALVGADAQVAVVGTSIARSHVEGEGMIGGYMDRGGGPARPEISLEADTARGRERAEHALERTGVSDAQQDEAEAAGRGWTPGVDDGRSQSVPRPRITEDELSGAGAGARRRGRQ